MIHFPVYLETVKNVSVLDLPLSRRASNALLRNAFNTVEDIINGWHKLGSLNNVGKKTVAEIKNCILYYQYDILDEKGKEQFVKYVEERNGLTT